MLSRQAIERAAAVLKRGELVILPTDTVPGIFVKDTPEGERRLRGLKGRGSMKPFARMFGSRKQLLEAVRIESKMQRLALERLLPGRVTLVLPSADKEEGTLGARLPMDASLRALARRTGPLIATSANLSGHQLRDPASLHPSLAAEVALVEEDASGESLDSKPIASSVIDLTSERPLILRKGACSIWTVGRRLGKTPYLAPPHELNVLFVCGGNTCRSPMAAALFRARCPSPRVNVRSAGLSAAKGSQAARLARMVMREQGLSLEEHRSEELSDELAAWADLILAMTRGHLLRIRRRYARFSDRTFLLTGFPKPWPHGRNIQDPIGGSLGIYKRTYQQIQLYIHSICPKIKKVLTQAN
jgi:tRNA threonylcarbamoyl adenosine modification protein (Sua5/YciO/YrdC/YwlC family)